MAEEKIIGIDLGTTNSVAAVQEGSEINVIPNQEGNRITPSVVAFTDKGVLVGDPAKRQAITNPMRTIYTIKRFMGRRRKEVMDEEKLVPYKVAGGPDEPVKIEVEADGKMYDELHVDGGTTREVFVLPAEAPLQAFDALYPKPPIRKFFIIKNGKASPEQQVVKPTTLQIASRAISTLIKSQNQGELYHIYRIALDAGADFNFMSVPASFNYTTNQIYDPKYQAALYAEGVREGRKGVWLKTPPGQAPITLPQGSATQAPAAKSQDPASVPSAANPPVKPAPTAAKSKKVAANVGWQSKVQSAP